MITRAILVAAGIGKRFGSSEKVFTTINNKPLFIWAIEPFEKTEKIDYIWIVTRKERFEKTKYYIDKFNIKKVEKIIQGGKERQDSVYNALKLLPEDTEIVLIHDAARPLINKELIEKVLIFLTHEIDGVIPGIPLTDTIKWLKKEHIIGGTLNRDILRAIQTPQAFWYKKILHAYDRAYKEGFFGTDDASLVERYGGNIVLINGNPNNIKITTKEDLDKMQSILNLKKKQKLFFFYS